MPDVRSQTRIASSPCDSQSKHQFLEHSGQVGTLLWYLSALPHSVHVGGYPAAKSDPADSLRNIVALLNNELCVPFFFPDSPNLALVFFPP